MFSLVRSHLRAPKTPASGGGGGLGEGGGGGGENGRIGLSLSVIFCLAAC